MTKFSTGRLQEEGSINFMADMKYKNTESIRYVVITPVRNEEKFIIKTADSMVAQTIRPVQWIIVNDGSTDSTASVIDQYAAKYSWITTLHRKDRGFRKPGTGVMEAFYEGYSKVARDFDFIVKLDGDLSFDEEYFEKCFEKFKVDPQLGVGGGEVLSIVNDKLISEKNPRFHVRGATKIYRKACWEAIGALVIAPGWDTLDEVKANMMGWKTYSFSDLFLKQLKFTGSADGKWKNWFKNGRSHYIAGYHPIFVLVRAMKFFIQNPINIRYIALLVGFATGFASKQKRVEDRELIGYLQKQQLNRLLFRKTIWK